MSSRAPIPIYSCRGSFLPFPIPYLNVPFFHNVNSGLTNINTFTHLFNPVIHIKQFQNCFSHTIAKSKLDKKSSVFIYAAPPTTPKIKVYSQILHSSVTWISLKKKPFSVIVLFIWNTVYLFELDPPSLLISFHFLNMENINMLLKVKSVSKRHTWGSVMPS